MKTEEPFAELACNEQAKFEAAQSRTGEMRNGVVRHPRTAPRTDGRYCYGHQCEVRSHVGIWKKTTYLRFCQGFQWLPPLGPLDVFPAQLRGRESVINQENNRKRRKQMRDLIENLISHLEHDSELSGFPRSLIELITEGTVRALEADPDLLQALAYEVGRGAYCDRCGCLLPLGEPAVCSDCHGGESVVQS